MVGIAIPFSLETYMVGGKPSLLQWPRDEACHEVEFN